MYSAVRGRTGPVIVLVELDGERTMPPDRGRRPSWRAVDEVLAGRRDVAPRPCVLVVRGADGTATVGLSSCHVQGSVGSHQRGRLVGGRSCGRSGRRRLPSSCWRQLRADVGVRQPGPRPPLLDGPPAPSFPSSSGSRSHRAIAGRRCGREVVPCRPRPRGRRTRPGAGDAFAGVFHRGESVDAATGCRGSRVRLRRPPSRRRAPPRNEPPGTPGSSPTSNCTPPSSRLAVTSGGPGHAGSVTMPELAEIVLRRPRRRPDPLSPSPMGGRTPQHPV